MNSLKTVKSSSKVRKFASREFKNMDTFYQNHTKLTKLKAFERTERGKQDGLIQLPTKSRK